MLQLARLFFNNVTAIINMNKMEYTYNVAIIYTNIMIKLTTTIPFCATVAKTFLDDATAIFNSFSLTEICEFSL